jgi:hypothetical protein
MRETVPLAAFADARASLWGVFVGGTEPQLALASLRAGSSLQAQPASLAFESEESEWRIAAGEDTIIFTSEPMGGVSRSADSSLTLCSVRGAVRTIDGAHEIACDGVRCRAAERDFGSLRLIAAWFGEGAAVALLAVRAAGAKGHDAEHVEAALTGARAGPPVFDARLSTTYGRNLAPRRVGIELWLGEREDAELQCRRLAGETEPSAGALGYDGLTIDCHALHAHDADASGPGVYLLVSRAGTR